MERAEHAMLGDDLQQTNKGAVYVFNTGDEQHKHKKKEELDTSVRLTPQTTFAERSI